MSNVALKMETAASDGPFAMSAARRNYILLILTLVGTLNFLDRQVLTVLIEPIRKELSLSDTQIGFLTGIAFAVVNVTLSIPAAHLADRWSRRNVIAIAIGIWSTMTVFCGFAQSYLQILLARMGVGVGEAGGSPPCQAFVGDVYPKEVRSTAMAFYFLSVPLGIGLGLFWGGWAVDELGWRGAFILAGIPGMILAPIVFFTLPEIRKGMMDGGGKEPRARPLVQTIRSLMATPAYRNLTVASTIQSFLGLGMSAWMPAFLVRTHGLSHTEVGLSLALTFAIPFGIGAFVGGRLTDLAARRDLRWYFWIPTVTSLVSGVFAVCVFLVPIEYIFWFLPLTYLFVAAVGPMGSVVAQGLAPFTSRATALALKLFIVNSVGMGLGPQIIGIVSDLLRPTFGEESLRMTLLFSVAFSIPCAFFYYRASLTVREDMAAAEGRNRN